jgi:hypothetical protein
LLEPALLLEDNFGRSDKSLARAKILTAASVAIITETSTAVYVDCWYGKDQKCLVLNSEHRGLLARKSLFEF